MSMITKLAHDAHMSAFYLAGLDSARKNKILKNIEEKIRKNSDAIMRANANDIRRAEETNLAKPLLQRLKFDEKKLETVCAGIRDIIALPDPIGAILEKRELSPGLQLSRRTTPIGVLGIVFESRPDALVQIATLALKSGNALLLKGGSEAKETNHALFDTIIDASVSDIPDNMALPRGWAHLLDTRNEIRDLLTLDQYIDLIISRGSNEFVQYIMNNTNIPVLGHADGICHLYIDKEANLDMAIEIALNAKTQYPAVCNAIEKILVHSEIAPRIIPQLADKLASAGVTIRGDANIQKWSDKVDTVTEEDIRAEYLDLIVAIYEVDSLESAITHINTYGSHHTDAIVTENSVTAERFILLVDSSGVFHNCSTRFADGYRYGLGAEVGIATGKLHARGPVGLEGLTTYKWILLGNGHIVTK